MKKLLSALLCVMMVVCFMPTMALAVEPVAWDGTTADTGWYEMDTAADTFTISTGAELAGLAKLVNEGTCNFSGKTIKLGANIDLDNKPWTPIGNASNGFGANFDGDDYKISNLRVEGGENPYQGLIGKMAWASHTLQNVTIENVYVRGSSALGALVGDGGIDTFKNVTITGHVDIGITTNNTGDAGYNASYAGGVVGHGYITATNCKVIGVNDAQGNRSRIAGGRQVGGILGFNGEDMTIDGCSVSNVDISGVYCIGGILGWAQPRDSVKNCAVDSITLTNTNTSDAKYSTGWITGLNNGSNNHTNNTATGGTSNLDKVSLYASYGLIAYATNGTDYFMVNDSLQNAIDKNLPTVVLLEDITENVTIAESQNLTLDLNGNSIDGTISNEGQLTIKNGTVWGTVTGNNPTYENASAKMPAVELKLGNDSRVKYGTFQEAVDAAAASGKNGYVYLLKDASEELTIPASTAWTYLYDKGCNLSGNVTNNGNLSFSTSTGTHNWTITNNGKLVLSKNQNTGFTVVNNGTLTISGGVTYDLSKITNQEGGTVSITGGTFNAKPDDAWIATGYIARQYDDVYKVEPMTDEEALAAGCVARYGGATSSSRKYYKTLSDGFDKQTTLHLLKDVTEDVTNNGTTKLYCEGNTFSGSLNCPGYSLYVYTNSDQGGLTLNSVQSSYLYVGDSSAKAVNVVINDGIVTGSIKVRKNSDLTINGGVFAGSTITVEGNGSLTIKGGTYTGTLTLLEEGSGSITIKGGTFATNVDAEYIADGYTAVPADEAGYVCKVVASESADKVEPATGDTVANVPETLTEIKEVAESVSVDEYELSLLASQECQEIDDKKANELVTAANDMGLAGDTNTITLYVQTYLKVEAETYDSAGKTLTLDITPMKKIVASTAGSVEDFQEGVNAKVVQSEEKIEVHTPVQMNIALPDGFVTSKTDEVYVKHEKGGKTYFYDCSIAENAGKFSISFCNSHGFSKFTITTDAPTAKIGEVGYKTLQEAVESAQNNDVILITADNSEEVSVNKEITFSLKKVTDAEFTGKISAGKGYKLEVKTDTEGNDVYVITKDTTTSGGGYYPTPTVQNPTIEASEGVTVTKGSTGTTLAITVADGYELVDVTVNGVSKGKVTTLTGLKTGDKVVVTAQKVGADDTAAQIAEVKSVKLVARTTMSKAKGKKAVKVYWYATDGSEVKLDGVEVFRSVKRYSGFGKKPIFTTTKAQYHNTAIETGTKYYYKVRGYKVIGGEKVYTAWSTKAWRTVK